jgi:hypothetical protein
VCCGVGTRKGLPLSTIPTWPISKTGCRRRFRGWSSSTTAFWPRSYWSASANTKLLFIRLPTGPFAQLQSDDQERAILSLLELRADISLPEGGQTVPRMAALAGRHPRWGLVEA